MATLKELLSGTHSPITSDYNPPSLSNDLMGFAPPCDNGQPASTGTPPPQTLFNLNVTTPFGWLWKRPKNVLQG